MTELERIKIDNPNKDLLSTGDLVVHEKYGVGKITDIETTDCWYPLIVRFSQNVMSFGETHEKHVFRCLNTKGLCNDPFSGDSTAKFYKLIKTNE